MKHFLAFTFLLLPFTALADWPTDKRVFSDGVIDISVDYSGGEVDEWAIEIFDESGGTGFHHPEEVILLGSPYSEFAVPPGSEWEFLGEPGDPVWGLGDFDNVLDPGLRARQAMQDHLSGDVPLVLKDHDGDGNAFLYDTSGGQLVIYWDTRPEEGPYGGFELEIPSHHHLFTVFTERGIHFLTLQASGVRSDDGEPTESEPTDLTYLIDPLPVHWWLLEHFGRKANQPIADLDADPDKDGLSNLIEYAFGLDPLDPSRENLPFTGTTTIGEDRFLTITYRSANRADLRYAIEGSSDLEDWEDLDPDALEVAVQPDEEHENIDWVTIRDEIPLTDTPRRFLRVTVTYIGDQEE